MHEKDLLLLAQAIAPVVARHIKEALDPLAARVAEIERDLATESPVLVDIRRELATIGPKLEERAGELAAGMATAIKSAVDAVPKPKDGIDGKDGRDGVDGKDGASGERGEKGEKGDPGEPGRDGEDGVAGIDGKDGAAGRDGERGERGEKGDPGERGADGAAGRDGVDGRPGEKGDRGEKGADGVAGRDGINGKDGAPGERGERGGRGDVGAAGEKGADGKDGVGLAGAVIDRDGELALTLADGAVVKLGRVIGKDGDHGSDGLGFDDLDVVDEPTSVLLRFVRGEQVKEFRLAKPTLADMHKGVWREGPYERGSVVTFGGSLWMAKAETTARPEKSDEWLLVTKRGRDGKDGEAPKPPAKVKL